MSDCINEIINKLNDSHSIYEMANISRADTGLPYDIWIDSGGIMRHIKHGPRVNVAVEGKNRYTMPSISIEDEPELKSGRPFRGLSDVLKWVKKYKDVLLKHYKHEISDKEALNMLGSLEEGD